MDMYTDIIGWFSATILAMTISRQVYTQWKTKIVDGISKWMFIGQLTASAGFVVYSALVENWIFVFANFYIFLTAIVGQYIYLRNKRLASKKTSQNSVAPSMTTG